MEAAPASEIGQLLDRTKRIELFKMEMNVIERKLTSLQKALRDFEVHGSSSECMVMLEKLENLEDQCEAVKQIMEVQSLRVSFLFNWLDQH